jgi:predicted dehydrogenase
MTEGSARVAVVGIGYWGPNILRSLLRSSRCHVAWACDQKPGRLKFAAENFPTVPLTDDYREVIEDPSVKAIFLATPVSTHYDLARAALEADKHVFIEKPLTVNGSLARNLLRLAHDKKKILFSGHVFVYHPAITAMKRMIQEGRLGRFCYAESSRINSGPPATDVDVLWDLAAHDVSIVLYLLEMNPVEVSAYAERYLNPKFRDVAFIRLRFKGGIFSEHHVSWLSPQKTRRFSLYGSEGSMIFDDTAGKEKLRVFGRGVDTRAGNTDSDTKDLFYAPGQVFVPELPSEQPLLLECEHFLDCISNGVNPITDGRLGLAVTEVLEAAKHSADMQSSPVEIHELSLATHNS